jgi:hypothetical protein
VGHGRFERGIIEGPPAQSVRAVATAAGPHWARPLRHRGAAGPPRVSGHLFSSFPALLLRKQLDQRLTAAGVNAEWADIFRDLERVEQIAVREDGKHFLLRPQALGCAGAVFQAVGVAFPPMLRQLTPTLSCRGHDPWPRNAAGGRCVVPRQADFSGFML